MTNENYEENMVIMNYQRKLDTITDTEKITGDINFREKILGCSNSNMIAAGIIGVGGLAYAPY